MNVVADIQWIKEELDRVEDPALIGMLKRFLQSRSGSTSAEMDRMIHEAETAIAEGRVTKHEALKAEVMGWRKKDGNHLD